MGSMSKAENKRAGAALVVGISAYSHEGVAPLELAAADARAVARILADAEVCNFPTENVVLLTDDKADRDALVEHLSGWLPEKGQGQDVVVVYFAGHGTVKKIGPREEGYLLPHDANPDRPATRGILMGDVSRWLESIDARAVIVCLDCCHAARAATRGGNPKTASARGLGLQPALLPGLSGASRFLLASCKENEYSFESQQHKHGLFTYYLLKGLQGEADENRDGKVGVGELFEYVAREVGRESVEKFGMVQTPWAVAGHGAGVYLAEPQGRVEPNAPDDLEDLWDEDRAEAVQRLTGLMSEPGEETLRPALRLLRQKPDVVALPFLFRVLAVPIESLQQRARAAIDALGWEKTARFIEEQARKADRDVMEVLVEGLGAFEAGENVVALLDRLASVLRDKLRERAIHHLGRKKLGQELEKTRELFRQHHSPYELQKVLGQGSLAAAYLAQHRVTDARAVVRVLRPELAADPAIRGAFIDLARRSFPMSHQNLVRLHDVQVFPEHGLYYIIRDHIEGVTLQKLVVSEKFEVPQILRLLRELAQALTPWHEAGFPHGGVKPSNIFVQAHHRIVLGDPSLPPRDLPMNHERLAYDFRYAASEMIRKGGTAGPPADVYALGCVAFELLCGQPPFVSDDPFELAHHHQATPANRPSARGAAVGPTVDSFVLRLLAKSPADRYADAAELLIALEELRSPPKQPDPPPPPPPIVREHGIPRPTDTMDSMMTPPPAPTVYPSTGGALLSGRSSRVCGTLHTVGAPDDADLSVYRPVPEPARFAIPGYEIFAELGRGGMGVVYKARHIALNRLVALKMTLMGPHAGQQETTRFRIEAEAIARLSHPCIVQVYEIGDHDGRQYFAMEFCEGGSLDRKLKGEPLPPGDAARLLAQLAGGVAAAHAHQVIHRDLKPSNILFARSDTSSRGEETPKIVDFGLARRMDESALSITGQVLGTPSYMAPEQAAGRTRDVGVHSDIYGLGAILYETLSGRPPFRAASPTETLLQVLESDPVPIRQLNPSVPRDLETICLKCLQKDPHKRYPSASALEQDLLRFLGAEPISARPVGRFERLWRWCKRNPAIALMMCLLIVVVVSASVVILSLLMQLQHTTP
jgi:serine/threonine protein kinase